jgi:hypothetical protein
VGGSLLVDGELGQDALEAQRIVTDVLLGAAATEVSR